jgi:hypothetical protein
MWTSRFHPELGDLPRSACWLLALVLAQRPDRAGFTSPHDPVDQRAPLIPRSRATWAKRFRSFLHDPDNPVTELPVELPADLRHDYS